MAVDMGALTADLAAESAELYEVLSVLAETEWHRDTPAAGWTVRDQVTHLAYFDEAATLSATDPDRFLAETAELTAEGEDFPDRVAERFRDRSGVEVFAWLQRARRDYLDTFAPLDPSTSLPWYGPPMSASYTSWPCAQVSMSRAVTDDAALIGGPYQGNCVPGSSAPKVSR